MTVVLTIAIFNDIFSHCHHEGKGPVEHWKSFLGRFICGLTARNGHITYTISLLIEDSCCFNFTFSSAGADAKRGESRNACKTELIGYFSNQPRIVVLSRY